MKDFFSLGMLMILFSLLSCSNSNSSLKELSLTSFPDTLYWGKLYSDTLYLGDTLRIKFETPHPSDFAITTPNGDFFFVVYWGSDQGKPSLYDWNDFANMGLIEIITDKTKACLWDARTTENTIIFDKTGTYEIALSKNLETDDDGTPVERTKVYYIHDKR